MTAAACRHCGKRRVNRPRGLCWQCYYAPGVKDLYPSTSKFASKSARGHEPSAEEVEKMVAEQMKCLPPWWFDHDPD